MLNWEWEGRYFSQYLVAWPWADDSSVLRVAMCTVEQEERAPTLPSTGHLFWAVGPSGRSRRVGWGRPAPSPLALPWCPWHAWPGVGMSPVATGQRWLCFFRSETEFGIVLMTQSPSSLVPKLIIKTNKLILLFLRMPVSKCPRVRGQPLVAPAAWEGSRGPSTTPGDMGLAWVPVIPWTHRVTLRKFLPLLGPQFSHQWNEGVDYGSPRVSFDSEVWGSVCLSFSIRPFFFLASPSSQSSNSFPHSCWRFWFFFWLVLAVSLIWAPVFSVDNESFTKSV